MQEFLSILTQILLPIFILISLGIIVHRKFELDLKTLSRLNLYVFVPGIIFVKLYETEFSGQLFLQLLFFFVLLIVILYSLSRLISYFLGHSRGMRTAFSNSNIFYNSGNYGVPVNDLVFKSDPFAMSIQIMILTFQNILTFSYGVIALQSVEKFNWKAVLDYFKTPVFYALVLGIGFNLLNVQVPSFILIPAGYISDGLVAIALITLGAQVAFLKIKSIDRAIAISLILRLIGGPTIAFLIIISFGLNGLVAQALFISSAMPTSVNSSIIAQVYDNEPEYAAQVVWMSTLLSVITVCTTIYIGGVVWG